MDAHQAAYNDGSTNDRMRLTMNELTIKDLATLVREASRQRWPIREHRSEATYRLAFGKEPIQLGIIEFRILLYLASRPYYAFSRRSIAEAVSTEQNSVREDLVDAHIASLLDQLGEFHNYVQSVPYIGYRFKA
jgi:DNA-binding response OmpR family regulator